MYNLFGISEVTHLVKTYFTELQYPIYSSMYGDILSFFFLFFFSLQLYNLWTKSYGAKIKLNFCRKSFCIAP